METEILSLFEEVQASKRSHKSLVKKFNGILNQSVNDGSILDVILRCILDQTLIHPKLSATSQRILDFFALSLVIMSNDDVRVAIFSHLANRLRSTLKHVRQRVCFIIDSYLVTVYNDEVEVNCDLLAEITGYLLKRLHDKAPAVRVAAVNALANLQDPNDIEDPVMAALLFAFQHDNSSSVRAAAGKVLVFAESTKTHFVTRLRDTSSDVRLSVLRRLCEEGDLRLFSRQLRCEVAQNILCERDAKVKAVGEKALLHWFGLLDHELTRFLSCFALPDNDRPLALVASWLVEKVMQESSSNEEGQFTALRSSQVAWKANGNEINAFELLWLQLRASYHLRFSNRFSFLQFVGNMFPSPTSFSLLLRAPGTSFSQQRLLLKLLPFFACHPQAEPDFMQNEVSFFVQDKDIPEDSIPLALSSLWQLMHMPQETNAASKINSTTHTYLVRTFQTLKTLSEESSDPEIVERYRLRALLVMQSLLEHHQPTLSSSISTASITEEIENFLSFVLSCLQQPLATLRASALSCLALLCCHLPTIRGKYRAVVQQVATGRFEDSVVQLAALEGIVDIATVAGDDFSAEERFEIDRALIVLMQNSSISADSGENALNYMNDEALLAIEASLKLVFRGFSRDPQLLASLLRFFFIEPLADAAAGVVSVDNNRSKMEQLVSVFLHSFLACQQESCLQLVRDSLSLFISDAVIAIRDEIIPHDSLGKVIRAQLLFASLTYTLLINRF
jgi:hypothetical protein